MDIVTKLIVKPTINNRKVATIVTIVFAIFILYLLARITWHFFTPMLELTPWQAPSATATQQTTQKINFSDYHWFGRAGEKPIIEQKKEQISDAPKTRLNLVLTGVVAHDDPARSMAIIEYQSKQDTYIIDQKIASTRASITEIHHDRVILNNGGKHETLMLDGFDYTKGSNSPSVKERFNQSAPNNTSNLAKTRKDILANPKRIIDHISITPVKIKGKLKGYRLNAGRDPKLFLQSGLKPNDLAVAINGYDLTDIAQSMAVITELKTMNNIMISVERDGQLTDIQFALPE